MLLMIKMNSCQKALKRYSITWYEAINGYLLNGDSYFETEPFKRFVERNGEIEDINEAIKVAKQHIQEIDDCFMNYAPRNEKDDLVLYRGMKMVDLRLRGPIFEYYKLKEPITEDSFRKPGETVEIKNFVSTSSDARIGLRTEFFDSCCLYELHIAKGIPIIDMQDISDYKDIYGNGEFEILLPRNLLFSYVKTKSITITPQWPQWGDERIATVIEMKVTMKDENQFNPPKPLERQQILRRSERLAGIKLKSMKDGKKKSTRKGKKKSRRKLKNLRSRRRSR